MSEIRHDAHAEIDVEAIIQRIRKDLKRRRKGGGKSNEDDPTYASPRGIVPFSTGMNDYYLDFLRSFQDPKPQGPIAHHGSPVVKWAKRFMRRVLGPYHQAIFARQEKFNVNVVGLMAELRQALEDTNERLSRVELDLRRIRNILSDHEGEIKGGETSGR